MGYFKDFLYCIKTKQSGYVGQSNIEEEEEETFICNRPYGP